MEQTLALINEATANLNAEFTKVLSGNKSAGTRARKYAMEINKLTKQIRAEITDAKKA